MRYYQMEAASLAEELNCDLSQGCSAALIREKKKPLKKVLETLYGIGKLHRAKFYYVDIIVIICFAISLVFSYLNKNSGLFHLTLSSLGVIIVLFLLEGYLIYRYREAYLNRLSESKQKIVVLRDGTEQQIAPSELVVGDLLILSKGSILYADARLVLSDDLFVDESLVFSSTISAEKTSDAIHDKNLTPEQQKNMVWKGSYVSSGSGHAIVVALGEECLVEKTGGRVRKKQRSFFYNKQNNIGHLASYIYIILIALGLLVSIIFSNNYVEAFLLMGVMASLIMLNPVNCLMEWTYYRTASKLYKRGVLIRNIEAFDGMNKEKDLYFDASDIVDGHLKFHSTVDYRGNEKSSLSYFSLCLGRGTLVDAIAAPLQKYDVTFESLEQNYPVFRRSTDSSGNITSIFAKDGKSVAVSVGYWENMLPVLNGVEDDLLNQIKEFELHGKMVYLMASDAMDFIPAKIDSDFFLNRMEITALVVFDISIDDSIRSMIHQFRRASMRVHLVNRYSEKLGKVLAATCDMDGVASELPQKPVYTLPQAAEQKLVVFEDASPIEKEQAMVVLSPEASPQKLVYDVKCMFCGIKRFLNYLSVIGIFFILATVILFMSGIPMNKLVFSVILIKPILLCPIYYLVETVRNCNQYHRSLTLGAFCGLVAFSGAVAGMETAIFSMELSAIFLGLYLLFFGVKHRKLRRVDLILFAVALLFLIVPWVMMGGDWLPAALLALFPPIGAFILDLFY